MKVRFAPPGLGPGFALATRSTATESVRVLDKVGVCVRIIIEIFFYHTRIYRRTATITTLRRHFHIRPDFFHTEAFL